MVRQKHLQIAIIAGALIALAYSGGAWLAAAQVNHGRPANTGANIEVTIAVVLGALAVVALFGALWANVPTVFGDVAGGIVMGILLVGVILSGDVWGARWFTADLCRDLDAHQHWYAILFPGSAAFLSWWITVSLATGVLAAYVRGRREAG